MARFALYLLLYRLQWLLLTEAHALGQRDIVQRTTSTCNTLSASDSPTFEQNIQAGLSFLRCHGVGPESRVRSIQAGARQRTGSRRPADFTRIMITMQDDPKITVYTTRNYDTARRVWCEPEVDPTPATSMEQLLRQFDFESLSIPFKDAFTRLGARGHKGPWKFVQVIAHEFVRDGKEPFYSFQPVNDGEPIWVGAFTGDIMSGFDGLESPGRLVNSTLRVPDIEGDQVQEFR